MYDNGFVDETKRVWSEWSGVEITDDDAREIIKNMAGFFGILAKWDRRKKQREDRDDE